MKEYQDLKKEIRAKRERSHYLRQKMKLLREVEEPTDFESMTVETLFKKHKNLLHTVARLRRIITEKNSQVEVTLSEDLWLKSRSMTVQLGPKSTVTQSARQYWDQCKELSSKQGSQLTTLDALSVFMSLNLSNEVKGNLLELVAILFPADFESPESKASLHLALRLCHDLPNPVLNDSSISRLKRLMPSSISSEREIALFRSWSLCCPLSAVSRLKASFVPEMQCVRVERPESKRISFREMYVPATSEQFERVWNETLNVKSPVFTHTFTATGIKASELRQTTKNLILENLSQKHLTLLAGRIAPSQMTEELIQKQIETTTFLVKTLFPDGKY